MPVAESFEEQKHPGTASPSEREILREQYHHKFTTGENPEKCPSPILHTPVQ
jgi:hypothetical protein